MKQYIVYVKTDAQNRIQAVNSSAFLTDTNGWIEIDSGLGDKYYHAQGNYFNKPLYDDRELFNYILKDGKPRERTEEEKNADFILIEQKPSQLDIIEAQITYTAMMTDTLLED